MKWFSNKLIIFLVCSMISAFGIMAFVASPNWGFYGHRTINKKAVFTLPQKMLKLYKANINYISDHAVDPDMRRYATKFEAIRHYIDIDQWDTIPFSKLPRDFNAALLKYGKLVLVNGTDSSEVRMTWDTDTTVTLKVQRSDVVVKQRDLLNYMRQELWPLYYEEEMKTDVVVAEYWLKKSINAGKYTQIVFIDQFSQHGILPYYLEMATNKLTNAFKSKNKADILKNSADIGHYIADAHVPLHTTTNYNGQLTDQVGIHAFWESRIPELFADKEYDYFVGKAEYVTDLQKYFWSIITDSHAYLDDVLDIEKSLSRTYPSDQQFCFEERLGMNTRVQCKEFAAAYHEAMQGMVEERMTASIKAVGDIWYTAWINAGSPDLSDLDTAPVEVEKIIIDPNIKTREHEN
ncbi:MAG: hypothetical protein IPN72_19740 [Saprospiraceae bacterium]|nr:hypothetical protein [Saprospiraceae bacterium]